MEITNDEIRLQIAPVLGWSAGQPPDGYWAMYLNGQPYGRNRFNTEENAWKLGDCPNWPEDMTAAWPLVDMVMGAETRVVVEILPGGVYTVFVWADGTTIERQADTAERAICLAFLAWKQAQS